MRSMLFVPATRRNMIEKAAASAADAVCLDIEDAVAPSEKAAARECVVRALREVDFGHRTRIVRVNALDTRFTYRDIIDTVETAGDRIDLIMLPKANSADDVVFVDKLLTQIEQTPRIGIEAQIETAAGFLYAREIARSSERLRALVFGPGDYSASMGMPGLDIGDLKAVEAVYPVMHTIVAAARANGLRAMDGPYAAFKDEAGFERSCQIARGLGFSGKQCIHPAQLETANRVMAPSKDELVRAAAMIAAYEKATSEGHGAVTFEGKMIDAANLRMARAVVENKT